MARMYSRRKGKSGSKTPPKRVPSWAPYKSKEVEKLIQKMGKAGKSASEIGLILRDSYGINSVKALTGKKVNTLLKEHGITKTLPEDMLALIKKLISNKYRKNGPGLAFCCILSSSYGYYEIVGRIPADSLKNFFEIFGVPEI